MKRSTMRRLIEAHFALMVMLLLVGVATFVLIAMGGAR